MSKHRMKPLVDGFSVGSREVIDNKIPCGICGQLKPSSEFTLCARSWSRRCKPCESDRVAMEHLRKRVAKYGITAEVISIQQAQRELDGRKDRLRRLVAEAK